MTANRRGVLAGAGSMTVMAVGRLRAQPRPKLVIGVLTDLSGSYRDNNGPTSVAAAQIAIEEMRPHVDCDVELISADHQNKPDVGAGIARKWFDSGVDVVAGVTGSAVALAVVRVTEEKDKVHLNSAAAVTALTDQNCSPNTLAWSFDTYMHAHSTGGPLVEQGLRSWFFITADYSFGHSLESYTADVIRRLGGEVRGSLRYPFPDTTDFSSYLVQAQASGAQVVAFANAGMDTQNCIKQAAEFGLNRQHTLAPLLMYVQDAHALGPDICGGLVTTESFYWDLNDGTRAFTKRLLAVTKDENHPNQGHASTYSSIYHYMRTVAAFGGAEAKRSGRATIAKMKLLPTQDDAFGSGHVRADGRGEFPAYLFRVKTAAESKGPWDLYHLVRTSSAEEVLHPVNPKCSFSIG